MENETVSRKNTARFAGLLFLIWILTGMYAMFYIPSQINMTGDAGSTAQNILNKEFLFRTGTLNSIISGAIWVVMVLLFYRLFKPVNTRLAKLLVAFVIVQIPTVFFMEAFNITSLMIIKGEALKTFDVAQRQDVAILFFKLNEYTVMTLVLFWGLWLLPLGALAYKSGFIPRFLGVWLIINGIAYVILSFTSILLPEYKDTLFKFTFPAMLGEIAFMLWLLIRGTTGGTKEDEERTPIAIP